jgi:hypothetical protein
MTPNRGNSTGGNPGATPPHASLRGLGTAGQWIRRRRGALAIVAAFAVIAWAKPMGLLLWARIRILTSIPKTAIADDPAKAPEEPKPPIELDAGLPAGGDWSLDPFRIDPSIHPKPTPAPEPKAETVAEPKVAPSSTDESPSEAIDGPRRASERFRLQAAGKGLSAAVIDGRSLRVGDALESADGLRFTLVEVLEGAVILDCEGRRFEIRLARQP